jgi:hypothetical protein
MQLTFGDFARTAASASANHSGPRPVRRSLPEAWAIAIYFGGALIAALGLGLMVAYGSALVGGAIIVCGLAVATIGNERWPQREGPASNLALLRAFWQERRSH